MCTGIQGTFCFDENGNLLPEEEAWEIAARRFEQQEAEKAAEQARKEAEQQTEAERLQRMRQDRINRYYDAIEKLLKHAGECAQAEGLSEKVMATPWMDWRMDVRKVMDIYWHNDPSKVNNAAMIRRQRCKEDIAIVNMHCWPLGLQKVEKPDVLVFMLVMSEPRRRAYRGYIKTRRRQGVALSMAELEQLYRKNNPGRFKRKT